MESDEVPPTYDLIEAPRAPRLPGTVVFRPDDDEALGAAASDLFMQAMGCVRAFGNFQLAVSGAPSNEPFFRRLMLDPSYREFPWSKTHLWLVDEIAVEWDHPSRRGSVVKDLLAEPSDLPRGQLHLIELESADPAAAYERQIGEVLGWREKGHDRFDYILLDPSPSHEVLPPHAPEEPLVSQVPAANPPRVSLTLRAIQGARCVSGIFAGAAALPAVLSLSSEHHPYSRLRPPGGEVRWYVDHAAAGGVRS
jgi:6-phosphogluconolactonase/glucosamine-6-phosphate isomerase/deaminase